MLFKALIAGVAALSASQAMAQSSNADLAKQLSNPIASLISVPFQFNYDRGYGPEHDGYKTFMNFQPVVPISLNDNWNLISRTILPVSYQHDVVPGAGYQFGLGDTVQSLFFSPKTPGPDGIIWGVGPVFMLPTGTDDIGANSWGAGPTAVVLKQTGHWTVGFLGNHLWDIGGEHDISSTFLQPFASYTTPDAWTFTLNSESTYDWKAEEASIPINGIVTKLITVGKQPLSIGGGLRYWVDAPEGGPRGWGARAMLVMLFPK